MKFLVLNGPNLNLLGLRQPDIYGSGTYEDLLALLDNTAREAGVEVHCVQSNHEGVLVEHIQNARGVYDGLILNPAAYTHTSIAILDALLAVSIPAVEVHISDPSQRESFRHFSYIREACLKTYAGLGLRGYGEAIKFLKAYMELQS